MKKSTLLILRQSGKYNNPLGIEDKQQTTHKPKKRQKNQYGKKYLRKSVASK